MICKSSSSGRVLGLVLFSATLSCSSAATLLPYPEDLNIDLNENECLHYAGLSQDLLSDWSFDARPIVVDSDVPVVLNRMTQGTSSSLGFGVPFGISVVVKSDCSGDNVMAIEPMVSTDVVDIDGQTGVPRVSIQAAPTAPALESRNSAGVGATFLPSSTFSNDIRECFAQTPTGCVPTTEFIGNDTPVPAPTPVCSGDPFTSITPPPEGSQPPVVAPGPADPTSPPASTTKSTTEASATSRPSMASGVVILLVSTLVLLASGVAADGGGHRVLHAATVLLIVPAAVMASSSWGSTSTGDSTAALVQQQQEPRDLAGGQCTVNVEIVYWGCEVQAMVVAPGVALRNNRDELLEGWGTHCKCQEKHFFEDPVDPNNTVNGIVESPLGNGKTLYKVYGGQDLDVSCLIAIGRPFRDAGGEIVSSSSALVDDEEAKVWSRREEHNSSIDKTTVANHANREALEAEWTRRALGEHASIASFGAFTIDLMSNQAPPDLIQDSLTAAQDELRHAKVSFEMASLLAGKAIEPTPLPASTLEFQKDLASLALGTAKEGCVEETFSAIEMAVAYDEYQASDAKDSVMSLLMDTTRTIALEEGNHSALAWRTIAWICRVDRGACHIVQREALNTSILEEAGKHRFAHSDRARDAWNCLWSALLPVVLGKDRVTSKQLHVAFECPDAGDLQSLLVQQIKTRVVHEMAVSMM